MKKLSGVLLFAVLGLCACAQSINPNQIKPGTFQGGTYTFPNYIQAGQARASQYCFAGGTNCITQWPSATMVYPSFGLAKSNGTGWAAPTTSDIVALFNGGACQGYLKSDGTCSIPSGGGMVFPAAGMAKSSGTAWVSPSWSDIAVLWAGGACNGYLKSDGTCSIPAGSTGLGFAPTKDSSNQFMVDVAAGVVYCSGTAYQEPATGYTLAANTTNYVFVNGDCSGMGTSTVMFPTTAFPIAVVTVGTTGITNIVDDRTPYYKVTGNGMVYPPAGLAKSSGSTWVTATYADLAALFSGCASATPLLRYDGTCSASGTGGSSLIAGPGVSTTSNILSTVGVTTAEVVFGNQNSLTANMQIAVIPAAVAFSVPANGAISFSSTMRNAVSKFYLGTLPTATWTATLYKYPAAAAGCLTSTGTSFGTVAITTTGAQTWTVTSTSFVPGDCLVITAPSAVDNTAGYPYGSIAVID